MEDQKVFCSEIIRGLKPSNNNLYELINIIPAEPIKRTLNDSTWHFEPQVGKTYIPKKRSRIKVKTVSDIRNLYEKDIHTELPRYLEVQRKILLRKIREGSSRNENTKTFAKNILNNNKPVSRTAWQMIMHLNPEDHKYSKQYILWNGKRIQINGSKGGNDQLICCYDLGKKRQELPMKKTNSVKKNQGMLKNALSVKFKPGPLTKKKYLDDSHQKYSIGDIELIELPIPGVHIKPTFDVALEPTITNFLHKYRDVDGTISESWAEFAVSMLGTVKDSRATQVDKGTVSFTLSYKYNQHRILMRRELLNSSVYPKSHPRIAMIYPHSLNENDILPEVRTIVDEILSSVEISLMQDNMHSGEEEPRDVYLADSNVTFYNCTNKIKRKYTELQRLQVTVINLDEELQVDPEECKKPHCSLGCVCASLNVTNNFKGHCGRIQCMFECICDHSKYNVDDLVKEQKCPELISGLIKLDNDKNFKLAKEEKKFHQTVILTGDKSIVFKSQKRSSKISKKYADFYTHYFKKENKLNKEISINVLKLNCSNIEPWCMIHDLYKCFCKGRFIEKSYSEYNKEATATVSIMPHGEIDDVYFVEHEESSNKTFKNQESNSLFKKHLNSENNEYNDHLSEVDNYSCMCARSKPFSGRKYSHNYYHHTNKKILQMEKNDVNLHTKLLKCMNPEVGNYQNEITTDKNIDISSVQKVNVDSLENIPVHVIKKHSSPNIQHDSKNKSRPNASQKNEPSESVSKQFNYNFPKKKDLVSLLESSYQEYKTRCKQNSNLSLLPPKLGKLALYPWDFITNRYREKKNLFLISPQSKQRIFMAVDVKHPFFNNCINIDNICLSDVDKYPATVRNLLTNAKDLKDHFCILRGLSYCWELVGSVSKTNKEAETEKKIENVSNTDARKTSDISPVDKNDMASESKLSDNIAKNIPLTASVTNESNLTFESIDTIATEFPVIDHSSFKNDFFGEANDTVANQSLNNLVTFDNINKSLVQNTSNSNEVCKSSDIIDINRTLKTPMSNNDEDLTKLTEPSKWFLMIVEDDFSEIQFYSKGFFVKVESIIQAINVARKSGKTVRLSSQKCIDNPYEPQFGLYAVPNSKVCTVFIGPYEKDESLGLEAVKKPDVRKQKRTRGVWFYINNTDNIKVIENPFLYLQVTNQEMKPLDNFIKTKMANINTESNVKIREENPTEDISTSNTNPSKSIKPIKIRKTNEFYHFLPGTLLKKTTKTPLFMESKSSVTSLSLNNYRSNMGFTCMNFPIPHASNLKSVANDTRQGNATVLSAIKNTENKMAPTKKKPVAEIAPQIKLNAESSKNTSPKPRKLELGILKPEEINQRLNCNTLVKSNVTFDLETQIEMDIENFLATSTECKSPNNDIFIISDKEEDRQKSIQKQCQEVWLQCKNIENLGAIKGRINNNKFLSFEFPGFKFTDFYTEKEAFTKINQVFSRKVYIPKHINLEWEIIECEFDLKSKRLLKTEDLDPNLVMTKNGLQHKQYLPTYEKFAKLNSEVTTVDNKLQNPNSSNKVGTKSRTPYQKKRPVPKIDTILKSQPETIYSDPSTSKKKTKFILTFENDITDKQGIASASDEVALTSGKEVMDVATASDEVALTSGEEVMNVATASDEVALTSGEEVMNVATTSNEMALTSRDEVMDVATASDEVTLTSGEEVTYVASGSDKVALTSGEEVTYAALASDAAALTAGEELIYIESVGDETIFFTENNESEQDMGVPCTIVATYSLGKGQEICELSEDFTSGKATTSSLGNTILSSKGNTDNCSALFQERSELLEEIGSVLWSETVSRKDEIMYSFNSVSNQQRQQMAEKLEFMMLENEP